MKRILSILSIILLASLVMVACNRRPATADASKIQYSDTVGLAEFQSWKAENERLTMQEKLDQQNTVVTTAPTRTRTVYRTASSGNTTTQPAKKGWSKAAKGAVIGGAGGAVLGAVINKRNRVAGGVIGGVIGAGVGYGIGRSQDKKDGRY